MNSTFKALAIASAAISFVVAAPASASTIVTGSCDSVTDGDTAGCLFSGNINQNPDPTNVNSYKNAEAAYNALMNPDITLNWLTSTDAANFSSFGSITGAGTTSGTFNLSGYIIEFYAVKYGPQFTLYQYLGTNGTGSWTTNGQNAMSHIAFFGRRNEVPEPATWAMMLIGFGAIGFGMRRRRSATLPQIA